jgi:hypothetical protein
MGLTFYIGLFTPIGPIFFPTEYIFLRSLKSVTRRLSDISDLSGNSRTKRRGLMTFVVENVQVDLIGSGCKGRAMLKLFDPEFSS